MLALVLVAFVLGVLVGGLIVFPEPTRPGVPPPAGGRPDEPAPADLEVFGVTAPARPARPGEPGWLARLGDPADRFADTPDGRFTNIHPAVWNATGTPAEARVYDVPDEFWNEVGSIQIDGLGDLNP